MSQDSHRTGSSKPVVHVRDNSDSELEALFKVAMNPQHVPFRERNLPASFFQEPQKHDNIYSPSSGINSQLTIAHNRAHSSPASLQQTLSAAPQPTPPSQHLRQHSCDNTLTEQPLPPGWEMASTPQGQRYYMNHITQTTTWEDPRKALSPSRSQSNITSQTSPPQSQHSPNISVQNLSSLPPGWEQAVTPDGEVYYINHMEKLTSWYDPRIPPHLQRPNLRPSNSGQSQQPPPPNSQAGQPHVSSAGSASQVSPPGQSQRQMSPSVGRDQAQMQQLQRLQLEKQKLAKQQEELARQEMLLRAKLPQNSPSPMQSEQANQEGQTTEMTSVADPFLGQTGTAEVHSRQESSDSGLGGMGTSYSLPRTPEDFLGNMEDMDTQDGGHQKIGEFNNMDIGNMGENPENQNMDGDELVPSLQEDISSELLNDVESVLNSNKMDNLLTWL